MSTVSKHVLTVTCFVAVALAQDEAAYGQNINTNYVNQSAGSGASFGGNYGRNGYLIVEIKGQYRTTVNSTFGQSNWIEVFAYYDGSPIVPATWQALAPRTRRGGPTIFAGDEVEVRGKYVWRQKLPNNQLGPQTTVFSNTLLTVFN